MIPKVIHYCWFGGNPLPSLAIKCIKSWKKFCPDYEIIEWNESNFDIDSNEYIKEAYALKKYAFVSDYARFKILYEYGGVYFDTDVELIKPIDEIISKGPFMGCEVSLNNCKDVAVAPGLGMASNKNSFIVEELLKGYRERHFIIDGEMDLTTIVKYTTDVLKKHGLAPSNNIQKIGDFYIYPKDYFNPINMSTGEISITDNTISIHHYAASWESKTNIIRGKIYRFIYRCFGTNVATCAKKIFGRK